MWDGTASFTHSNFLYPPAIAVPFRLLAMMPYSTAKLLWMLANGLCIALAMFLSAKELNASMRPAAGLLLAAGVCAFQPLLIMFERGQIDGATLLLLSVAFLLLSRGGSRRELLGGALLAVLALIKFQGWYFVPFFLLFRSWRPLMGFALGTVLCVVLQFGLCGIDLPVRYYTSELQRIAMYDQTGTESMKLPDASIAVLRVGLDSTRTVKDGKTYEISSITFVSLASIPHLIKYAFWRNNVSVTYGSISVAVFLAALLAAAWVFRRKKLVYTALAPDMRMAIWWWAALVVLVTGPLTWTMNLVWALPLLVLFTKDDWTTDATASYAGAVMLLGWALMFLPDAKAFGMLAPELKFIPQAHYVLAEVLVAVGTLAMIVRRSSGAARDRVIT